MNDATSTLRNPTLWLVVGIPLATVLASILTVTLAFQGAEAAIAELFGGDRELYGSFRAAFLARVETEQQQGLSQLRQGNLAALGRMGHSLKSALRLLGEPDLAAQAQVLERL